MTDTFDAACKELVDGSTEKCFPTPSTPDIIVNRDYLKQVLTRAIQLGADLLLDDYSKHPEDYPDCLMCLRPTKKTYKASMSKQAVTCLFELIQMCIHEGNEWIKPWHERESRSAAQAQGGTLNRRGGYTLPDGSTRRSDVIASRQRVQEATYFGLVERVGGKQSGQYRPTQNAVDFVNGKIKVRSYYRILGGKPIEASAEMIGIYEVKKIAVDTIAQARKMCFAGADLNTVVVDESTLQIEEVAEGEVVAPKPPSPFEIWEAVGKKPDFIS